MYYKQLRAQANLITQSEWQELSAQGKADMLQVPVSLWCNTCSVAVIDGVDFPPVHA